jgi:chaperonin cofactor prefoldin
VETLDEHIKRTLKGQKEGIEKRLDEIKASLEERNAAHKKTIEEVRGLS